MLSRSTVCSSALLYLILGCKLREGRGAVQLPPRQLGQPATRTYHFPLALSWRIATSQSLYKVTAASNNIHILRYRRPFLAFATLNSTKITSFTASSHPRPAPSLHLPFGPKGRHLTGC
jgi:hypothetical protein